MSMARIKQALRALRARFRSERGTALVEFAIVSIPLFLIVFGILEFGRALNYYNDLTQLAGQGARAASVNRNPDGTAIANDNRCGGLGGNNSIQCQLAKTYPTTAELQNGIGVCLGSLNTGTGVIGGSAPSIGQPVTVRAKMRFPLITGRLFGFTSITLSATQTEIAESNGTYAVGNIQGANGLNACTG
jgi:hypothetical protein